MDGPSSRASRQCGCSTATTNCRTSASAERPTHFDVPSALVTAKFVIATAPPMTKRTGGRILVDQLRIQGCDRIFTVPGESFLAVLDALHDTPEIDLVVCRQEGGVAYMADADGKMTGRPGVAFVTRGP